MGRGNGSLRGVRRLERRIGANGRVWGVEGVFVLVYVEFRTLVRRSSCRGDTVAPLRGVEKVLRLC